MILVLLTRFSGSKESISGYKLCQVLVEQGHDLFVTSVSTGEALETETEDAKKMSMKEKGSITLLHPDDDDPQPEWLTKYHEKYFSYLSGLDGVKVVIGTLPGTEETASELAGTLKSKLILFASKQIPTDEHYLEELKKIAQEVDEFWSAGSDVHRQNDPFFQNVNVDSSQKHREILLQHPSSVSSLVPGSWTGRMVILVLLHKFSESPDSLPGYQLCLQLVKQGHKLYVTTTSTAKRLESEIAKAEELTKIYPGKIKVVTAQCNDSDQLSQERISDLHLHYFSHCSQLQDVDNIIGLLPGTAQAAVELRKKLNCKLVLLATTKIRDQEEDLKEKMSKAMGEADEIWSVGPDLYSHYELIHKNPDVEHRNVLLKPFTGTKYYWQSEASKPQEDRSKLRKFVSIWNHGYISIYEYQWFYSNRSKTECFSTVCSALGNINGTKSYDIQWHVYGVNYYDSIQKLIRDHARPIGIKMSALTGVTSADELLRKGCDAFLVPDTTDETFNFIALSAIWLGIPTLVSSMSSVGKFLLSLDCAVKTRAVVFLSGNVEADKEAWKDKIYKEILNENANTQEWARELSNYLHNNTRLWDFDLSVFSADSRLSGDTTVSSTTAHEKQPNPEVLAKVWPWLQTTQDPEAFGERECSCLSDSPAIIYCEQCKRAVCDSCATTLHHNHNTISLEPKDQNIEEGFNSLVIAKKEQDQEISRRMATLTKYKVDIDRCASDAIEQMTKQHEKVQQIQLDIFNEQLSIVNKWKEDKLKTFHEERSLLEHLDAHKNSMKNPSSFIQRASASDLPPSPITSWNPIIYRQPSFRGSHDSQHFRNYIQEHILGYFDPETSTTEAAEAIAASPNPRKGSIQSEYSVSAESLNIDFKNTKSMMAKYDSSQFSEKSHFSTRRELPLLEDPERTTAEFVNSKTINAFKASRLRTFLNALFLGDSMWICGWTTSIFNRTNVFLRVQMPHFFAPEHTQEISHKWQHAYLYVSIQRLHPVCKEVRK